MLKKYYICIVLGLCLLGAGCAGSPPVNERAAAKIALDAALEGQAQIYAKKEYQKAEKTMQRVEETFSNRDYKNALILSNITTLQAKYALAVANWKIKASQLERAQGTLRNAMEEADQARIVLEEAKKQLH